MNRIKLILGLLCVSCVAFVGCDNGSNEDASGEVAMMNEMDSVSYAYGVMSGDGLFKQGIDLNSDIFSRGFAKSAAGEEALMNTTDAEALLRGYFSKLQQQEEMESISLAEENKKVGAIFLAENAKRGGVQTTESGLQYEVMKAGTGKSPTVENKVKVHYTGTLTDGTVFDSSVERGQPATFGVTQVIKGWTEALLLMKEGDKWKVFIPSDLAYGDVDRNPIPPGSTLIFEMELLEVQ